MPDMWCQPNEYAMPFSMKWLIIIITILLIGCNDRGNVPLDQLIPEIQNHNLLVISLDTLRKDRLGVYGCSRPISPFLDSFTRDAGVMTDVMSQCPSTIRSHRAIFTGQYLYAQNGKYPLPEETMAGILTRNGFQSAAFVDGGLMNRRLGNDAGFSVYDDDGGGFARIRDKAMTWLDENMESRFFLFLHTYDIHFPYTPPEPYRDIFMPDENVWFDIDTEIPRYYNKINLEKSDYRFINGRYDAGIRYVDGILHEIIIALMKKNLLDETLILIVSDHGESLGERQYVGHHKLYDVQLRVPAVLFVPGAAGTLNPLSVENIDFLPTLLNLFSLDIPESVTGSSLLPWLPSKRQFDHPSVRISERRGKAVHAPDGWKLIIRETPEEDELYYVDTDPEEVNNMMIGNPEHTRRLKEMFIESTGISVEAGRKKTFRSRQEMPVMKVGSPEDQEFMEQLKVLGYIN